MTAGPRLRAVSTEGVPTPEALAAFLRWLATHRGRSGRITSPQTLRAYTTAVTVAFAGIGTLDELDGAGADRLQLNVRTAWGHQAPATFNARRAAVASALTYFRTEGWLPAGADPLAGLDREHQPKPRERVRPRGEIDRLVTDKRIPLADRALFAMLYSTAARAEEVLRLDVTDLDRANRRAHTIRKGGKEDELLYDTRTARLLGQLLGRRTSGPVFLSNRRPTDGTVPAADLDPASGRRRMTYRTAARHLATATGGWELHDLRHSRLTHAGEDGATEADLMNLSGHEDRRSLQRYLKPSKEGTQRRLDAMDVQRGTWTPGAREIAARLAEQDAEQLPGQTSIPLGDHPNGQNNQNDPNRPETSVDSETLAQPQGKEVDRR